MLRKVTDDRVEFYDDADRLHCDDGPAVKFNNGLEFWYRHGVLNRKDGPAINGHGWEEWLIDGILNRADGPAITHPCGSEFHFKNGKYHNSNGPAIKYADGEQHWYIDGEELTETEFNKLISLN